MLKSVRRRLRVSGKRCIVGGATPPVRQLLRGHIASIPCLWSSPQTDTIQVNLRVRMGGTVAAQVSIRAVKDVLETRKLKSPDLALLQANNQIYRALLFQAAGPVYADAQRIGPFNLAEAEGRADRFLAMAASRGDQLVITPEYFLPVASLRKAALGDSFPANGSLWVLGCESMTPAQLVALKAECEGKCEVIYEDDPAPQVQGNYFDPVAYCFVTQDIDKVEKRVVLIQFKTTPSRDDHGFENKYLRCGRDVYQFRGDGEHIKLSTIICSDAFSIGADLDANKKLSDRSILIHIQLNPKPKHSDYRRYREVVFSRTVDLTNCDIICLNWAEDVVQLDESGEVVEQWKNESGSAWYLPPRRCSVNDAEVAANEAKGLYYTWHDKKRHVLHFHYDEAVFALTVPKVVQDGLAVEDVLVGPLLDASFVWDEGAGDWIERTACPETGWTATIGGNAEITSAFQNLHDVKNRLGIERAISLSCGPRSMSEGWYQVDKLDVCRIPETEVVARATIQLDRDVSATAARELRIRKVATLGHILKTGTLPAAIKDLEGGGAVIGWSSASPNTNVTKDGARPALVAYLGEGLAPDVVERIGKAAFELLRRENKEHKNRVAVCYRVETGAIEFAQITPLTDITYDGGSMASITGGE